MGQRQKLNACVCGRLQVKLEEQTKKAEDLEETVHATGTEIKRLEMEVDSAVREKVGRVRQRHQRQQLTRKDYRTRL